MLRGSIVIKYEFEPLIPLIFEDMFWGVSVFKGDDPCPSLNFKYIHTPQEKGTPETKDVHKVSEFIEIYRAKVI